jgi:hypothetical protein
VTEARSFVVAILPRVIFPVVPVVVPYAGKLLVISLVVPPGTTLLIVAVPPRVIVPVVPVVVPPAGKLVVIPVMVLSVGTPPVIPVIFPSGIRLGIPGVG